MHWRRFKISDIPHGNSKAFEVWLRNRWREKDYMLEYFSKHQRFPATDYWKDQLADANSDKASSVSIRSVPRSARTIITEVKSGKFDEFLRIFAPITGLAMALFLAYGASPDDLPFAEGKQYFQQHLGQLMGTLGGVGSFNDVEKMLEQGPGVPTEPPKLTVGNTPADKIKQQKYLKLFKDSLPPDISIEAEQRRRMQHYIQSLPTRQEAQKAALEGARQGYGNRNFRKPSPAAKAATVIGSPSQQRTMAQKAVPPPKAHSVHGGGSATRPTPAKTPSNNTATPRFAVGDQKYAIVNGVRIPITSTGKQGPAAKSAPKVRFAEVNGVRIPIQSLPTPEETVKPATKDPEKTVTLKSGVKIKALDEVKEGSNPSGTVQTKSGVKIKQSPQKSNTPTTTAPGSKKTVNGAKLNNGVATGVNTSAKPTTSSKPTAVKPTAAKPTAAKPTAAAAAKMPASNQTNNKQTSTKTIMTANGPRKLAQ
jgi:hypothetical protein